MPSAPHKPYTALLVDDDRFLLSLYAKKAERYGLELRVAEGAEKALEMLRGGFEPEVLLVDIEMPVMGGLDLLERMRAESLAPDAGVIVLTNKSDEDLVERARALRTDEYLIKAAHLPAEIMDRVGAMAAKRRAGGAQDRPER